MSSAVGVQAADARGRLARVGPEAQTEIVVDRCLARIAGIDAPQVLDVGTGSGAIALALADEAQAPGHGFGHVAGRARGRTRERLPDEARGRALQADLFEGLPTGPWDIVVSSLSPYVHPEEIEDSSPR